MTEKPKTLDKILPLLPRFSYSVNNKQMEPITLVVIGSKNNIKKALVAAGWHLADRISITSTLKSLWTTVADSSYRSGPMWPAFINGQQNSMGYEIPTRSNTFRRRHHMRIWKTKYSAKNNRIWVGTISYDSGVGFVRHTFIPTHHISPNLELEEEFLARTLSIMRPIYVRLAKNETGVIGTGDPYVWNGRALIVNLSDAA